MSFISLPLIVLILLVVGITVLVVRAGGIALRLTGLDAERVDFQALSAVTGTGFTTRESELVVADPRRRRIVGGLMIFGDVVFASVIGLMVGSFTATREKYEVLCRAGLLVLVVRPGEVLVPNPAADERIRDGDLLVCYGDLEQMHAFASRRPESPPADGPEDAPPPM